MLPVLSDIEKTHVHFRSTGEFINETANTLYTFIKTCTNCLAARENNGSADHYTQPGRLEGKGFYFWIKFHDVKDFVSTRANSVYALKPRGPGV